MKTTRKRGIFLIVAALLAVVVIAAAGWLAWGYAQTSRYQKQIEVATHYWEQADYVNAKVAFTAALKMDDTQEDAYVGLVQVYQALGDDAQAQIILADGLRKTSGKKLKTLSSMQTAYFHTEGDVDKSEQEITADGVTPALNTSLLETLGSNTYDNYRARYGIESCNVQNDSCEVRVTSLAATMHYYPTEAQPTVLTGTGDKPVAELRPTAITLDNVSLLFSGGTTVSYEEIKAFRVGDLKLEKDDTYGHVLTFTAKNCKVTVACDENGTVTAGAWNRIEPEGAALENADGMKLSGKVISAVSAQGVNGAELTLVSRSDGTQQTVTTDSYGGYSATLPAGDYRVTVRCSGYVEETFDCTVSSYNRETEKSFTITPTLSEGQIRIVLTWGSSPTDLDSYLSGTTDSGASVFTSYYQRTSMNNGTKLAELDVDDRDGYGPETTTIYDINGVYEFTVMDYTGSGTMSSSGAVVKVYTPDSTVEIPICAGLNNGWSVCKIDHGTVTVTNTAGSVR